MDCITFKSTKSAGRSKMKKGDIQIIETLPDDLLENLVYCNFASHFAVTKTSIMHSNQLMKTYRGSQDMPTFSPRSWLSNRNTIEKYLSSRARNKVVKVKMGQKVKFVFFI